MILRDEYPLGQSYPYLCQKIISAIQVLSNGLKLEARL